MIPRHYHVQTTRGSFELYIVSSDEGTSYCRLAEQGAAPVTPMDELRAASAEARPGGLVERVGDKIANTGWDTDSYEPEARAAIREVAAALLEWHYSDQIVHTAWEAAKWLEREAER